MSEWFENNIKELEKKNMDEQIVRNLSINIIKHSEIEESDGTFCIYTSRLVLHLLGNGEPLSDERKETLQIICKLAEVRKFPMLLWTRLISQNLDNPKGIIQELKRVHFAQNQFNSNIHEISNREGESIGLVQGANIFVNGYSSSIVEFLTGLKEQIKNSLNLWAPVALKKGISEGGLLKDSLNNRIKVEVLEDSKVGDFLLSPGVDFFLSGTKVVSYIDNKLNGLNSWRPANWIVQAKENATKNTKIVIICGKFKFWPKDLYEEIQNDVFDAQEYNHDQPDMLLPGSKVDFWVTEEGKFTSDQLIKKYGSYFQPVHQRFTNISIGIEKPTTHEAPRRHENEDIVLKLFEASGINSKSISKDELNEIIDVYRSQIEVMEKWDELIRKYEGQYLAYSEGEIIAHANTISEIEEKIAAKTARRHIYVTQLVGTPRIEKFSPLPSGVL